MCVCLLLLDDQLPWSRNPITYSYILISCLSYSSQAEVIALPKEDSLNCGSSKLKCADRILEVASALERGLR